MPRGSGFSETGVLVLHHVPERIKALTQFELIVSWVNLTTKKKYAAKSGLLTMNSNPKSVIDYAKSKRFPKASVFKES